jgi:drug/metabolite transporter (DMT)-like permease
MIPQRLAANTAAFVAAVFFGSSVVAVRVAVQEVPPLSLAVLRFGQGGLLLVLLLLATRGRLRIEWRDLPLLTLLGAIFFTVFPVTFNASLRLIEASRGALVLATIPRSGVRYWHVQHGVSVWCFGRLLEYYSLWQVWA